MLPRNESQPSGKVAAFGERLRRRRKSLQRRRADRANAGDAHQPTYAGFLPRTAPNLLVKTAYLFFESCNMLKQQIAHHNHRRRQAAVLAFRLSQQSAHMTGSVGRDDAML